MNFLGLQLSTGKLGLLEFEAFVVSTVRMGGPTTARSSRSAKASGFASIRLLSERGLAASVREFVDEETSFASEHAATATIQIHDVTGSMLRRITRWIAMRTKLFGATSRTIGRHRARFGIIAGKLIAFEIAWAKIIMAFIII